MGTFENKENTIRWAKDKRIMHLCHVCNNTYIDISMEMCDRCRKREDAKAVDKVLREIDERKAKLLQREEQLKNKVVWTEITIVEQYICKNCSSQYKPEQHYCTECGTKLE